MHVMGGGLARRRLDRKTGILNSRMPWSRVAEDWRQKLAADPGTAYNLRQWPNKRQSLHNQ